jgi:hypothetical protein
MELAEQAVADFQRLHIAHRKRIQSAPFRFLSRTISSGSFISSRSSLSGLEHFFKGNACKALEPESRAIVGLGMATGLIAQGGATDVANAKKIIRHFAVSAARAEEMWAALLRKAEKDRCISADEVALLKTFREAAGLSSEVISEADSRLRTQFRAGMKIYLSGGPGRAGSACEGMSKEDIRKRCEQAGLVFLDQIRKKDGLDAVVVADLSTEGGSRAKAERWDIPVMSWDELLDWASQGPSRGGR